MSSLTKISLLALAGLFVAWGYTATKRTRRRQDQLLNLIMIERARRNQEMAPIVTEGEWYTYIFYDDAREAVKANEIKDALTRYTGKEDRVVVLNANQMKQSAKVPRWTVESLFPDLHQKTVFPAGYVVKLSPQGVQENVHQFTGEVLTDNEKMLELLKSIDQLVAEGF